MKLKAFSIGVIISLAVICSSCNGNKPSDSVIKSFRALEEGKVEEAMTEYSVSPFFEHAVKSRMSERMFGKYKGVPVEKKLQRIVRLNKIQNQNSHPRSYEPIVHDRTNSRPV